MIEITRLVIYLNKVHKQGRVCVFYDLSGHVNWFSISLRDSKENYEKILYDTRITLNVSKKELKEVVDEIIKDIYKILKNIPAAKRKATIEKQEEEKIELKRLKDKYEK